MLDQLLGAASFVPHGYCLLWRPDLVALHAGADLAIAGAYFSIPAALFVFLRRRNDLAFSWLFALFAAFILACGTGHLIDLATLWWPAYGLQGLVKAITALVSVATAAALWPIIPRALALPSPAALRAVNGQLAAEVEVRMAAEAELRRARDELELRVARRTRELEEANAQLSREVAERQRAMDRLAAAERDVRRLAHHDALTGLPNRLLLQDRLETALARARRSGSQVALTLLDLDDFKGVNDTLGHAAGDALLQEVAQRLHAVAREGDTWARLGGDEFVLVQPDLHWAEDAVTAAGRVLEALATPFRIEEGQAVEVTASLGVTVFPNDGDTPDRLMRNADVALYRAKTAGRNRAELYRPEMDAALAATRSLQKGLRQALDGGGLQLAYQPIYSLPSQHLGKAEALLRWPHPSGGFVPPSTFIPVAEASGLIHGLGSWTLREACCQAAAWRDAGTPLKVAVNVSPMQLRHPEFVGMVCQTLARAGLDPSLLELELTESVFLDPSKEQILEALGAMVDLGVTLAIDDFGTGYSSLGYLKHFPFNEVKVDGSFVADIGREPGGAAIAAAVVALAHSLGKRATAEGVETETQLAFLQERGCDAAQGYLLCRPMPGEEVARLAATARTGAMAAA